MDDLLDHAPCGFLTFTDDGTIRMANTTLRTLLGYGPGELEGGHFTSILSFGARIFYQTHLFPTLKLHGKVEEIYLSLRTRTEEEIPVLLNGVRRHQERGEGDAVTAVLNECILVPMRQRSRFEDEILRAKKAAEEATHAKEQAYAALAKAHEELEEANIELEVQQDELQTQQEQLLELNARLHARAEREALLNRIGQALRKSQNPEETAAMTVAALGEALNADRCYFIEFDPTRDWAIVRADWHRSDLASLKGTYNISDFDLSVSDLYRADGLLLARDFCIDNRVCSPRASAAIAALGIRSGIGAAVFEGKVPVASLNVAMADAPRAWTREEVQLVQSVATLTRSIAEEVRLRARERRIAQVLQNALRPAISDDVPGLSVYPYYQPALDEAEVGGDFFDVFSIGNGRYALVVADLSGKGLAAASQVATVRHMLRTLLYQKNMTVAQAVACLNNMLAEHNLLEGFATLFVGAFDVNLHTLTYVNAGQEPGLILQKATGQVEELEPTGPVLGGVPGAAFTQKVIPFGSGDVLAVFTDGLTEAGPNRKDMLGIGGIATLFQEAVAYTSRSASPSDISGHVMAGVETIATSAGIRDDVCLLVACVE